MFKKVKPKNNTIDETEIDLTAIKKELTKNKNHDLLIAVGLYVLCIITLFLPLSYLLYIIRVFPNEALVAIVSPDSTLYFAVILLILLAFYSLIMISLSKFCFTLAKSYKAESIRYTEKIFAIKFAEALIASHREKETQQHFLNAFNAFNSNNDGSSFSNQSSSDFAPNVSELLNLTKK